GDWIEVGGKVGRVHEIKWRATTIVTKDGDMVIIPNNALLTTHVVNFSRPTLHPRAILRGGRPHPPPPNPVKAILLDAVRGVPGVLATPEPDVIVTEFSDSAVTYLLRYWIDDFARDIPIDGEVHTRVWYAARRAGIEIPYPIRMIVGEPAAP